MTQIDEPPLLADYNSLHGMCVRVRDADVTQSGFWIERNVIASCAHGFPDRRAGEAVCVEWGSTCDQATIMVIDRATDVLLLRSKLAYEAVRIDLAEDVLPPDQLYAYGYTRRNPEGESLTVDMEGWSRAPLLLKLKLGQVERGMSGAPLYSLRTRFIVGMVRVSRDPSAPVGGRAVPAATMKEVAAAAGLFDSEAPGAKVAPTDLQTILGIFEAAYAATRPIAAVDQAILSGTPQPWLQAEYAKSALGEIIQHDAARRDAVKQWYAVHPGCLRFITSEIDGSSRRIGATCVLPLSQGAYMRYRAGQIREFDLAAHDLTQWSSQPTGWLCFQSFAIASQGDEAAHRALRRTIVEHVRAIVHDTPIRAVIAEIGTEAGMREAEYFEMRFRGLSALGRPLFELDGDDAQRWLVKEAAVRD
jgi:hypothetical protein